MRDLVAATAVRELARSSSFIDQDTFRKFFLVCLKAAERSESTIVNRHLNLEHNNVFCWRWKMCMVKLLLCVGGTFRSLFYPLQQNPQQTHPCRIT